MFNKKKKQAEAAKALPTIDTSQANQADVSTLASPDILNNLEASEIPEAFGDQLPYIAGQQIIANISRSTLARLYKEKARLIQEGIDLDKNHAITIQKIEQAHTPSKKIENGKTVDVAPKLTDEQYQEALKAEQINYDTAIANLQIRKDKNQTDIDNIIKDPFKKQKEEAKKRKDARSKAKSKNQGDKRKAKSNRRKSVLGNAKKTLIPIMTLLISDKIAEIISQNDVIKTLVDTTNQIIIAANTSNNPLQLANAKIARDNAIRVIQSNEDKINKVVNQIKLISTYIKIFGVIVQVLSSIPIPTAVPPGVGIPVNLILKLAQLIDKANRIVLALSAFLPTITDSLQKAIDILEDYKSQLLAINGVIDSAASFIPDLNSLLGLTYGDLLGEYKGFKFVLREENNPKFVVRGNKRHYAVAINKQNIEQLKSDYSFTLDPNDLVAQLKLVIDQQNLQG
jgi:hypothetical protein